MGLNDLRSSSRSKLLPNSPSKSRLQNKGSEQRFGKQGFENVFVPKQITTPNKQGTLRTIVIDGQNVAVEHAKGNMMVK